MSDDYERFMGPARFDRDLSELEGILQGIAADGRIEPDEVETLARWCAGRRDLARRGPMRELIRKLDAALEDGQIDGDELLDLVWFCEHARGPNAYYSTVARDMQRLHGILGGIAADGRISAAEVEAVRLWLAAAEHLRGSWPYDEIDAVMLSISARGEIDETDHRFLMAFCREALAAIPGGALVEPNLADDEFIRLGVCAACPEIAFAGRRFCVTGTSPVAERDVFHRTIESLGGAVLPRVRRDLDFLVVSAERNECWAYSCYGRKIELAVKYRRKGLPVCIVHESDFWDAAEDAGAQRP